jgi:Helicase HerA, central domain
MAKESDFISLNKGSGASSGGNEGLNFIFGILQFALWLLIFLVVAYIVAHAVRLGIYYFKNHKKRPDMVYLEILLPKENAEDSSKDRGNKQVPEIIAISENIFQVISAYSTLFFFSDWFAGSPSFTFEIIKAKNKINFYVGCPPDYLSTIEKQITSSFTRCRINIFNELDPGKGLVGHCQDIIQKKPMELPFRTYTQMTSDPMNNLVNALEVASGDEVLAFQMILSPIGNWWQAKGRAAAHNMQNEKDKKKVASQTGANDPSKFSQDKDDPAAMGGGYLTPNQQNIVKRLEEKASRPGYRFTLRVAGYSETKKKAEILVGNFMPSLTVFDIEPFNGLTRRRLFHKNGIKDLPRSFFYNQLSDFENRRPCLSNESVFSVEEANTLWHLPNYMVQSPSVDWMVSYKPTLPTQLPQDPNYGILVGHGDGGYFKKPVYQSTEDRTRHSYILGGSGSGKSFFMINLVLNDIAKGFGVCVVDPHGELVDEILYRIPKDRIEDVIVLSPAFTESPLGLNILWSDPTKPEQKTIVINNLFSIWNKLYDMQSAGGPQFEYYMKNAARLVMGHAESGNTLMEISKVFSDKKFRDFKIAMCQEPDVVDFWLNQANKAKGEQSLENMTTYITSKLAPFITNDFIRPMIGQCDNAINFRMAMDNRKIVLVKLEKGLVGEMSMYLMGMVIISNILNAGMGRADGVRYNIDGSTTAVLASERIPFFVYIDEMQNFLFDAIPQALEEIRKYKVGFNLAHQFVKQVITKGDERLKDSIMANTGSKFIFNCGVDDAEYLEKEFKPTLIARDLMNPERFTCNVRLMINGQKTLPFNMRTSPIPDIDEEAKQLKAFLIDQSKLMYGTPIAEVIADMAERTAIDF